MCRSSFWSRPARTLRVSDSRMPYHAGDRWPSSSRKPAPTSRSPILALVAGAYAGLGYGESVGALNEQDLEDINRRLGG